MEEKVNETTVQVDAELNKKKKVWESDIHGAIFDVDQNQRKIFPRRS